MLPSHENFLTGSSRWHGSYKGIGYELSWHGKSDYSPQGTWCWYIMISDEQFYTEDWLKLRLGKQDQELYGSWRRHWDYDNFPDLEAHGGWTYGEMSFHLGRDGKEHEHVKVGCDYNHSWDGEMGYPNGKEDLERDVKRSIDALVAMFPKRRERCSYCGKFDDSDQFYTARNGNRVHNSQLDKLRETGWDGWLPVEAAA